MLQDLLIGAMILYIISSVFLFSTGVGHGISNEGCKEKVHRIEYLIPAYRIGCWLGSPVK